MSSVPAAALEALSVYENAIKDLLSHLDTLFKYNSLKDLSSELSFMESAQLYTTVAYSLDTLYFNFLKVNGIDTEFHPVKKDLDRVREYMKKLKELEQTATERISEARIDKESAERFIRHALNIPKPRTDGSMEEEPFSLDSTASKQQEVPLITKVPKFATKRSDLPSAARSLPHKESAVEAFAKLQKNSKK